MKAVIQRVRSGRVLINDAPVSSIGAGMVILVGVAKDDGEDDASWLAAKCAGMRIFEDDSGKMNLSLVEVNGRALVVSQFTLLGDARKGRRPSFDGAAEPLLAEKLYESFVSRLKEEGVSVESGRFRTRMIVEIENDGPVTILLDSTGRGNGKNVS